MVVKLYLWAFCISQAMAISLLVFIFLFSGPSVGGPQNSDGIYEVSLEVPVFLPVDDLNFIFTSMYCCWFQVPYENGNNKQPKPSPNLDHEYAEPIKPSTKSDPHYKVRFFLTTCWTLLCSHSPPFWQWVVSQEKACSQSDLWFGITSFVNPSQC